MLLSHTWKLPIGNLTWTWVNFAQWQNFSHVSQQTCTNAQKNSWLLIQSHQKNMYRNQNMEKKWKKWKWFQGTVTKFQFSLRNGISQLPGMLSFQTTNVLMSNVSEGLKSQIFQHGTRNSSTLQNHILNSRLLARRHESGSFHAKYQGIPCSHDLRCQKFTTTWYENENFIAPHSALMTFGQPCSKSSKIACATLEAILAMRQY